jgi:hypothetical protein
MVSTLLQLPVLIINIYEQVLVLNCKSFGFSPLHPSIHPSIHLPSYLPTYPPTYPPTSLPTYLPTTTYYLPTYLHTYLPTHPPQDNHGRLVSLYSPTLAFHYELVTPVQARGSEYL